MEFVYASLRKAHVVAFLSGQMGLRVFVSSFVSTSFKILCVVACFHSYRVSGQRAEIVENARQIVTEIYTWDLTRMVS
jgi:hypothetical protein